MEERAALFRCSAYAALVGRMLLLSTDHLQRGEREYAVDKTTSGPVEYILLLVIALTIFAIVMLQTT